MAVRRRGVFILLVVAVAALIAAGFGAWWMFFRSDEPAAVDIETAVGELDDSSVEGIDAPASLDGRWTVDAGIQTADGTSSFAGFRVDEELSSIGSNTVVGRTSDVRGSLEIAGAAIVLAEMTVDMATLATDDSRRDGRMRDALDTDQFPVATFRLTEAIELGSLPTEGQTISAVAIGEFTIHGVTNSATVTVEAAQDGGVLIVTGSSAVVFADYGVTAPTAPVVVSVDDAGTIEWQLYFTKD